MFRESQNTKTRMSNIWIKRLLYNVVCLRNRSCKAFSGKDGFILHLTVITAWLLGGSLKNEALTLTFTYQQSMIKKASLLSVSLSKQKPGLHEARFKISKEAQL